MLTLSEQQDGSRPATTKGRFTMNSDTTDIAAAARHAQFGKLPERVRPEDMVEERTHRPGSGIIDAYDPESAWQNFSCVALDLGL
ncbi:hypothetical protein [Streptomyces rishiriensis]|uniref:Uncharacterized protein n=1 Tax=Streptomyces rishiriensis TaxID=68264 RepID=A0ABU0P1U3_STRRH|nr:hypothetical protein [Streptomyces rishiriensis]MDQ0585361.1 hypothetical protein [Streptomyces rishiriensis]